MFHISLASLAYVSLSQCKTLPVVPFSLFLCFMNGHSPNEIKVLKGPWRGLIKPIKNNSKEEHRGRGQKLVTGTSSQVLVLISLHIFRIDMHPVWQLDRQILRDAFWQQLVCNVTIHSIVTV